ncbi:hypothetical protein [Aliiglaciecola sp. LCG003]|uniref:hypothetical protein n=1 Tax=Aliiglaciecola sp. LCG003 TaxID=3053655 RepID=UPI002573DB81|nr:hypothetical protein [Aliiglaciecola sp. LCG003]WJG09101.1 hypothetical protein QR722_17505 [Aliiglaciecola sp. LCG003]
MQKIGIIALTVTVVGFALSCKAQEKQDEWLDTMHQSISESVMDSAQWFDNFFALKNQQEDQKALGEIRVRLGWEPRSRELDEFEAKLRIRVKLPNLKNRVDLILSDYDDADEDKIRAGRVNGRDRKDNFSLALRYKTKPDSGFSHRIGFGRRFQYFTKSRYRDAVDINENLEMRYDASIYYYNRDKFGTDLGLALNYDYSPETVLRFDNRFYFREKSDDWLWQHSWQMLHQIDDSSAMILGYYIEGLSRPSYHLEKYLLSVKLRKNAFRQWLYFDLEPFIVWRREESFSASFGVALRVEGFFGER